MKLTQKARVLQALRAHPEGLSVQYIKRTMMITEANARVSNLREDGYVIENVGTDGHGFAILKIIEAPRFKTVYEPVIRDGRRVMVGKLVPV